MSCWRWQASAGSPHRSRDVEPGTLLGRLFSGGRSSLVVAPVEGLTLEDKQSVNRALLQSDARHGYVAGHRRVTKAERHLSKTANSPYQPNGDVG
jgi:glycerate-2-kinase